MKKIISFLVVFLLALLIQNLKANHKLTYEVPGENLSNVETTASTYKYRVYIFDKKGVRREYLNSPLVMFDPSRSGNGRLVRTKSVSYDKTNNLIVQQSTKGKLDYGYLHADGNSISKFMAAPNGKNIGLFTLTDGKKLVIRLDYNGDAIIDHMEVYDAVYNRVTHFVLENTEALNHYDEMLEGKNVFCMLGSGAGGTGSYGFGIGVPNNTIFQGCGENGFISGHGIPKFNTDRNFKDPEDIQDSYCKLVLSKPSSNSFGGVVADGIDYSREIEEVREGADGMFKAGAVIGAVGVVVATPAIVTIGAVVVLSAGVAYGVSWLVESFSGDNDAPLYIPGYNTPEFNWENFCEQRAQNKYCYSLRSLENAISQNDCQNPAAQTGSPFNTGVKLNTGTKFKSSGGKFSSPSGGKGNGSGSSSTCPWQPYSPASGKMPYCQDKMQHPDLGSIWARINEERCNNPVAQPGPSGTNNCGTSTIGTSSARLQVAAADIISPGTTQFIDDLLNKVVNPGVGLYNLGNYRNDIPKLRIRKF